MPPRVTGESPLYMRKTAYSSSLSLIPQGGRRGRWSRQSLHIFGLVGDGRLYISGRLLAHPASGATMHKVCNDIRCRRAANTHEVATSPMDGTWERVRRCILTPTSGACALAQLMKCRGACVCWEWSDYRRHVQG